MIIKSVKDLSKIITSKNMENAFKNAQTEIAKCIQESIDGYYNEKVFRDGTSCEPEKYERTYKLLNSLVKPKIVKNNSSISFQVKIDESYLNYQYPNFFGSAKVTGEDVLTWNNEDGSHGYIVPGEHKIWDNAMAELSGEYGIINYYLKNNLKKHGFHIL